MRETIIVKGHMCICTDRYVNVVDSSDVSMNDIHEFIHILKEKIDNDYVLKGKYKIPEKDWERKWIFYKKLYKMKSFKPYIKDIYFYEKESLIELIIYRIFGRINRNTN